MATSRRRFLDTGLKLLASGLVLPRFLARTAWALPEGGGSDRMLVVVQLSGGNDGINTLIPYSDPNYYRLRPTLAAKQDQILPLDANLGLHPNMQQLFDLYRERRVAVLPGVGYPNPNRSHFRSMEIWQTAEPDRQLTTGWIGRFIDTLSSNNDLQAVNIGESVPLALLGQTSRVTSFQSPEGFQVQTDPRFPDDRPAKLRAMRQIYGASMDPNEPADLDYIRQVTLQTLVTADELQRIGQDYQTHVTYPNTAFARGLQSIVKMMSSSTHTPIYYISLGGFDTHAQQVNTQANLLRQLSEGLVAFYRDLEEHYLADRVLTFTFSEFGRRVHENGSAGTDHGTALPMFAVGFNIQGGIHGSQPSLEDLDSNGDLRFQVDFRSVYATVLRGWLGADADRVLGAFYPSLNFL